MIHGMMIHVGVINGSSLDALTATEPDHFGHARYTLTLLPPSRLSGAIGALAINVSAINADIDADTAAQMFPEVTVPASSLRISLATVSRTIEITVPDYASWAAVIGPRVGIATLQAVRTMYDFSGAIIRSDIVASAPVQQATSTQTTRGSTGTVTARTSAKAMNTPKVVWVQQLFTFEGGLRTCRTSSHVAPGDWVGDAWTGVALPWTQLDITATPTSDRMALR